MGKLAFRLHDSPKTRESQRRTTGEGQETRTRNPAAGLILENQSLVKIALLPQLGILHQLQRLAPNVESQEMRMSLHQESPLHGSKLPTKAVPEPTMLAHGDHRLRWLGSLVRARKMNRDHRNRLQSFLDGVTAAISRWTRIWPEYSEPMSLPPTFCVGRPMSPDTAVPTVLTRTKHQLEQVTLGASAKQLGVPPRPNGPKLLFMRNEAGHHPI